MPGTFEAVAVLAIAILPGALYVFAFEGIVGRWGIGLSDRLLRFVGGSAVYHALAAPGTYWIWREYIHSNRLGRAENLPLELWAIPILYVGVPLAFGSAVGKATKNHRPWAKWITGVDPAPRAWDYLFGGSPQGWVRMRLKSGVWVGGAYAETGGRRSYVAGYPEPGDIYLVQTAQVDPETGTFTYDDDGHVILGESGLLLRWDEVEYLEFVEG